MSGVAIMVVSGKSSIKEHANGSDPRKSIHSLLVDLEKKEN